MKKTLVFSKLLVASFIFLAIGCDEANLNTQNDSPSDPDFIANVDSAGFIPPKEDELPILLIGKLEQRLINAGLVNIQEIDSTLLVDLKYSSTDNFLGIDLYGDLKNGYLQEKPARMLARAQAYLKQINPDLSLLIYDGARPLSIQQKLWDTLDLPPIQKKSYVADPKIGSIHNYGSAVDLTIAYNDGTPLDMGTPYDYFGELAHPAKEDEMLEKGLLTEEQVSNRKLLRDVMVKAGFSPIKYEWWHFNAVSRNRAKEIYQMIE